MAEMETKASQPGTGNQGCQSGDRHPHHRAHRDDVFGARRGGKNPEGQG